MNDGILSFDKHKIEIVALTTFVNKRAVFSYSKDQITAYVITICHPTPIGTMPFGGQPSWLVSILYHSCYWFDFKHDYHPNYIGEKLNLGTKDSEDICELLNYIGDRFRYFKKTNI